MLAHSLERTAAADNDNDEAGDDDHGKDEHHHEEDDPVAPHLALRLHHLQVGVHLVDVVLHDQVVQFLLLFCQFLQDLIGHSLVTYIVADRQLDGIAVGFIQILLTLNHRLLGMPVHRHGRQYQMTLIHVADLVRLVMRFQVEVLAVAVKHGGSVTLGKSNHTFHCEGIGQAVAVGATLLQGFIHQFHRLLRILIGHHVGIVGVDGRQVDLVLLGNLLDSLVEVFRGDGDIVTIPVDDRHQIAGVIVFFGVLFLFHLRH